jgi:uncharacterized protein (TIGR04255 family)
MTSKQLTLPEFENPPVSEVAISIEFQPLTGWRGPHAGLYWSRINREYPQTEVVPPLSSQLERFDEGLFQAPAVQIEMMRPDASRVWFVGDPPTYLVQIQRNRFIVNWRKVTGDEIYPRYDKEMRPRFLREWQRFQQFVSEHNLGAIDVAQCEITYVNDILRGEAWNSFAESLTLLANWTPRGTINFLPPPETLTIAGAVRMPEDRGRLHFATQHVIRQIDQREAIQLRLVARGRPQTTSDDDVLKWIDMGHEWIVLGFADITSAKAQELWKRIR